MVPLLGLSCDAHLGLHTWLQMLICVLSGACIHLTAVCQKLTLSLLGFKGAYMAVPLGSWLEHGGSNSELQALKAATFATELASGPHEEFFKINFVLFSLLNNTKNDMNCCHFELVK